MVFWDILFEYVSDAFIQEGYFFYSELGKTHKIQSFIGVFIYELGFIGVFYNYDKWIYAKKLQLEMERNIIAFHYVTTECVPLGWGLVPLLFGSKLRPIARIKI